MTSPVVKSLQAALDATQRARDAVKQAADDARREEDERAATPAPLLPYHPGVPNSGQ